MTRSQLKDLNFIGWIFFLGIFTIVLNGTFHEKQERDFVYFYSVGRILNESAPSSLYDYKVQTRVFDEVLPRQTGKYGLSPYPPFVALFFRPFGHLPYWVACRIWISVTMGLYVTGLALLARQHFRGDLLRQSLLFCFGLTLRPFLGDTLVNGQLSAVGFFSLALAVYLEEREKPYLSGLALSMCLYKPTLLLLLVPMILVSKRARIIGGFTCGALALVGVTSLIEGWHIWVDYIQGSIKFAGLLRSLTFWDYIDISSFSRMLAHGSMVLSSFLIGLGVVAGMGLVRVWIVASRSTSRELLRLVWAVTITWTLILNLYVPMYDSILVVISIAVSARAFSAFRHRTFTAVCVLVLACSYLTKELAEHTDLQILTIAISALGVLQLMACMRAQRLAMMDRTPHESDALLTSVR